MLLAREKLDGEIHHHLLLLKYHDDTAVAIRGTVVSLIAQENELDVLHELKPRKQRVVLS